MKTAALAKVKLCEYENQPLEAFAAVSRLYTKLDCLVTRQNTSLLATAHDYETDGLFVRQYQPGAWHQRPLFPGNVLGRVSKMFTSGHNL